MQQGFRIPPENRTSVSKLRETNWQQRLISEHECLDLIPFFKLPRTLLVIILSQWITIEALCLFDTAVTSWNSRNYLLQDILLDEGFVVASNKLECLEENSNKTTQNAVLFAKYLHFRQIFVRIFDFTHWTFPITEISDFLRYLWHYDVDNERFRQIRALKLPKSALTYDLANVVGSKLQYLWYLCLSGAEYAIGDSEFKNLIFTCKHLTCLDISTCACISNDAITFMARRCVSLTHFIWQGHNTDHYVFLCALGEFCKKLQLLDLATQNCQRLLDRDLGLIEPTRHFQQLKYINLSGCDKLTEAGILLLVSSITTLDYFIMCFERPGTEGMRGWERPTPITDACIVALSMNNRNLKGLLLRGCALITNNCLLTLLQNCKSLDHVDVTGSSCTSELFAHFNIDNEDIIVMDVSKHKPLYVQHLYLL
jgi:hypothetical protein